MPDNELNARLAESQGWTPPIRVLSERERFLKGFPADACWTDPHGHSSIKGPPDYTNPANLPEVKRD